MVTHSDVCFYSQPVVVSKIKLYFFINSPNVTDLQLDRKRRFLQKLFKNKPRSVLNVVFVEASTRIRGDFTQKPVYSRPEPGAVPFSDTSTLSRPAFGVIFDGFGQ